MKKFLRILGGLLMFSAVILSLVTLICIFPMSRDLHSSVLESVLLVLCMLLMYFGLFCAGWLLKKAGSREKTPCPSMSSSAGSAVVQRSSWNANPSPSPANSPAKTARGTVPEPPLRTCPLPEDPSMELYRDDKAREDAALREGKGVPERLLLILREDQPYLQMETVQLGELFSGSMFLEEKQEKQIPTALCSRLNVEGLISFAEKVFPCLRELDWTDFLDRGELSHICQLVRTSSEEHLRDVYLTTAPFPRLDGLGMDGLKDDSGIRFWLRMRVSGKLNEALAEASRLARRGKTVLLTEDPGLLGSISAQLRDSLEKAGLLVGLLQEKDMLTDLVTGKRYQAKGVEWAGAADDAAANSRWWMTELGKTD